jgi:hypothetical protein
MPGKETILHLASALELSSVEENRLLLAGGFAPNSQFEPVLTRVAWLLDSLSEDEIYRQEFINLLERLAGQAEGYLSRKKLSSQESAA